MHRYEKERWLNPIENIEITYRKQDPDCGLHTHEFVEMLFIESGTCEQWVDGVKYIAEPGDLLFINYGQTHSYIAKTKDFKYYNLLYVPWFFGEELINSDNIYEIFETSLFREFVDHKVSGEQIVHFRGNEYIKMKKLLARMHKEFCGKEIGYRTILNGYSRVLFAEILRKLKSDAVSEETQKYMNRIVSDCLAYIEERCFEKVTLKELAQHTFYNPVYLGRIFKESCGMSLAEYIKEKRINEAAHLLTDSSLSIEEIMGRVGYSDKKHFYQNFRDIYNETPAQFRKNHTDKNTPAD